MAGVCASMSRIVGILPLTANGVYGDDLFQRERMFGFDAAELAHRESAARMALQVFDVGPGTSGRFLQRLHRSMTIFAAHKLVALGERFIDGARQPTATYFYLALRHHRRLLLRSHGW